MTPRLPPVNAPHPHLNRHGSQLPLKRAGLKRSEEFVIEVAGWLYGEANAGHCRNALGELALAR